MQFAAQLALDPGKIVFEDARAFGSGRKTLYYITKKAGERLCQNITATLRWVEEQRVVIPDLRNIPKAVE
ncbi:MAG: hypothetical protein L3J47_09820 [Sulfurovum sp.]|nr:hypothetical protein [Sulfurovum sp.]